MAKKEYYFQGKSIWSRVLKPDLEFRCWSQPLVLSPESYDLFMKLKEGTPECEGLLNEVKSTEDGYLVNFKRAMSKVYNGKETAFAPPVVVDANNMPWQSHLLIGNGSDLTVKVEWYSFLPPFKKKKGSAIRLLSVRVDALVPYEIKKDFTDVENKAVKGLAEVPKQIF